MFDPLRRWPLLGLLCCALVLSFAPSFATPVLAQDEAAVEETATEIIDEATPAKKWEEMTPGEQLNILREQTVAQNEEDGSFSPLGASLTDVNTLWTCLAAFLVFFMQAGFAAVETGFTRAKNACNIIMKNLMDFAFGTLIYWALGFGLMFGIATGGFIGTSHFLFDAQGVSFDWAFLIFQTVFAATAATIVSGAMAERTKFASYLIYTCVITAFIYPVFGCWAWNSLFAGTSGSEGGWLGNKGFYDFAGSTVVHSVGGWCALAGAIVLGPRIGKYVKGKVMPIPGHNIPLAAMGVFILWLGWFGFNPGSTVAVGGGSFAYIAVITNLSAAAGAVSAMVVSWIMFKKPDPSFSLNGALAGLVAITAGCDAMSPAFAILTGLIGGALVVLAVVFFDRIKIDDPVGAVSVHGICGAWGTLAVGLFLLPEKGGGLLTGGGAGQLITQLIGVGTAFAWAFPTSLVMFLAIKYTIGLRVSAEEEIEGLDIIEHGMLAYPPGFVADSFSGSPLSGGMPAGAMASSPTPVTAS